MTNLTHPVPSSHIIGQEAEPPTPVFRALGLFWLSLGISAGMYFWGLSTAFRELPTDQLARKVAVVGILLPLLIFAFDAYLNTRILRKKNWARTVKAIYLVLTLMSQLAYAPDTNAFVNVSAWIALVLGGIGLYFLFVTPSRQWFSRT
ncbi:hypothetical protein GTP91_01630 [Rugamonas sp. FT82W]|uniref:Uncharacterized protein n=1 Tax=Duganella vulcania TaxID=2692166 RepID=A0A845FUW7_9BURK|nr:hypothetical protein [Duganella vulcania]MYM85874.1 hypothetical protein [Duganella vulcania]